ncbi:MAG TPA: preprotein translocase subunit SecG [Dissulfurispiraceae bacterium]|nr:preprotein translocase subunit SecG [Dissulfurispiraceae bacterium]
MGTLLVIIHIVCCIFLISIVLLQGGKGAEMGAAFGGSSQTIFGSRGASTFLSKLTTGSAIVFMLTSLILSMVANKHASVIKEGSAAQERRAAPQQLPQQPVQQQPVQQPLPQQPAKK